MLLRFKVSSKITVVTRSDGSGTTFVFTLHLGAISDVWKSGPGAGKSVKLSGRRRRQGLPRRNGSHLG
jgi:phosphate transport system substrate-binding protein